MAECVYIVEEESVASAALDRILTRAGFRARLFPTAASLVAHRLPAPTWLLVGVCRHDEDGLAGLRSLRAHFDAPLVAICGAPDLNLAARALHAGAVDVLVRPFAPDELLALLREADGLLDRAAAG